MNGDVATRSGRLLRADAARSRRQVIDAAQRLLAGQPQASMDAIAAEARVGRSTAFRHFPHREELVRVAWIDAAVRAAAEIDEVDLDGLTPRAAVERLIGASVAAAERYPLLVRGARPPVDDPELISRLAATESAIAGVLERAVRAEVLRADLPVAVLVEHLLGCTQGVVLAGLQGAAAQDAARSLFLAGAVSDRGRTPPTAR